VIQWDWVLILNFAGFSIAGLLFWLRGEFFQIAGGSITLLLIIAQAALLRHGARSASKLLLRIVLLVYTVLILNVVIGFGTGPSVSEWLLGWMTLIPVFVGTSMCLTIPLSFMPPFSKRSELPPWGQQLWARLVVWWLSSLILFSVLWGLNLSLPGGIAPVGALGAAAILLCSVAIGYLSLRAVPPGVPETSTLETTRKILWLTPLWFLTGSILELLTRANWGAWLLSSFAVIIVLVWVHGLVSRSPLHGAYAR